MTKSPSHQPSPTFHLIAFPWDFPADGRSDPNPEMAETFDRLRGEVGVTGLALWGATPPMREFRVREVRPRLFQSDGGLHFEPMHYQCGCRPRTPLDSTNLVPVIAQACKRSGLSLRLILATASMGGIASYYPEFAARNAFDDPSRISVCLLHPAVRECIVGLVTNIPPNFGVEQIALADFRVGWFEARDRNIHWPGTLGEIERAALGLCFCSACLSAARDLGADTEDARASVRNLVQRSLTQGTERGGSVEGFLAENKALAGYVAAQSRGLITLLEQCVSASHAEVMVMSEDSADLHEVPGSKAAGVTMIRRMADLDWRVVPADCGPAELTVPAQFLLGAQSEAFVAAMSQLGERGFRGFQVDRFGALPDSAFATLKQAIRFARRSVAL